MKRTRNNVDPFDAAPSATVSCIRFGFGQVLLVASVIGLGCSSTDSNAGGPGAAGQGAGRGGQGGADAAESGGAAGASAGTSADAGSGADAGESAGGGAGAGGEAETGGGSAGKAGSAGANSLAGSGGSAGHLTPGSSGTGGGAGGNECVWDATHPEICPACDAHDGCSRPGYKYVGSGAITSSCCGLEWQEETASGAYSWSNAIDYCASLSLLGGGWRLPNIAELYSLVDLGGDSTAPTIDVDAFADTAREPYWSSSPDGKTAAWSVNFSDGASKSVNTDALHEQKVRCVR